MQFSIIFAMLGEAATNRITKIKNPRGLEENKATSKEGGEVAGNARRELEIKTGESAINEVNYLDVPESKKRKEKRISDKTLILE